MVFEVGVVEEFEAAHRLEGDEFGPAGRIHGHTYRVEVRVSGARVSDSGVLCDIASLRESLHKLVRELNYNTLNELEPLRGVNTTTEELARFIHSSIRRDLRGSSSSPSSVEQLTVLVWENQRSYGAFSDKI